MEYENYIELYEAVYFFNRINHSTESILPQMLGEVEIKKIGINTSIYKAVMRILVVNNFLDFNGNCFEMTDEHQEKHQYILNNVIRKRHNSHYADLFNKAVTEGHFFFDNISDLEYEIYSRCNFSITFETGKEIVKYIDFSNKRVLELGGNSGGLGSSLLLESENCFYTVVDTEIPCMVGTEFKEINEQDITFIVDNVFKMTLPTEIYDYIIIMNLLHDFDDINCLDILRNCIKHCDGNTKFLIIEDILIREFEPKDVIMHGLRLAVECRGGKQRTSEEFARLFSNINYKLENKIILNKVHSMLIMGMM